MRHILLLALAAPLLAVRPPARLSAQRVDRAEHHEFAIANFRTESGVTLPKAIVVYGTYGHLNAAHDNVVLLPSHYMATHHGYEVRAERSTRRPCFSWRRSSLATATRRVPATRRNRIMGRAFL